LQAKKLGYEMVGTHRRIRLEELLAYKDKMQAESAASHGRARGRKPWARVRSTVATFTAVLGIESCQLSPGRVTYDLRRLRIHPRCRSGNQKKIAA
jgi:hypothetical protein